MAFNPQPSVGHPFYVALKFLTFIMNGSFTRAQRGSKNVPKYKVFGSLLKSHDIQIAGIQEHHIA